MPRLFSLLPRMLSAAALAGVLVGSPHHVFTETTDRLAIGEPDAAQGDVICGPRCAQFVLKCYGVQAELHELVDEIQDADWSKGSTFASVRNALARRGVRTLAISVDKADELAWPGPVIVHLNGEARHPLGHFVVQLPHNAPHTARAWCGLAGVQEMPQSDFAARRSGVALLTSSHEIQPPCRDRSPHRHTMAVVAAVAMALALHAISIASRNRRGSVFPFKKEEMT